MRRYLASGMAVILMSWSGCANDAGERPSSPPETFLTSSASRVVSPEPTAAPAPKNTIVFDVDSDEGGFDLYTMQPDGSELTRLTNDETIDGGPAWSPDKTAILWQRGGPGTFDGDVFVMNPDGSGRTRLTRTETSAGGARWSPDRQRIVFSRTFPGGHSGLHTDIYTMRPDGSGMRRLTNNGYINHQPVYSPSGRQIVFTSDRSGSLDLYRMRADGSRVRRVTSMPGDESSPDWSPDGSEIVFVKRNRNLEESIVAISPGGSGARTLTSSPAIYNSPRWSPDGSRILFIAGGTYQIFTMAADGTDIVQITDDERDHLSADW